MKYDLKKSLSINKIEKSKFKNIDIKSITIGIKFIIVLFQILLIK